MENSKLRKTILFLLFIFTILFQDLSFGQNAFSDAILISKNRTEYLENITMILQPEFQGQYTEKQKFDLENLQKFLINPWDPDVVKLNFKVVLDIAKIILNFDQLEKSYQKRKKLLEEGLIVLSETLNKKRDELKNLVVTDSLTLIAITNLENEIKKLDEEQNINQNEIKKLNESIDKILETKDNTAIINYEEFKVSLENKSNVISQLGKDNEAEVQETVSDAHFSISQAALIEAIGNAIIEQVKEQVINNLLENVLSKKINLTDGGSTTLKTELEVLFPKTINLLSNLKENSTGNYYTNLNTTLKNAFNEDLKEILNNVTNEKRLKESKILGRLVFDETGNYKNDILTYLKLAQALIENIKNGFHPVELIPLLKTYLENSTSLNSYTQYISMIDLLQKNLRDVSDKSKKIWVDIMQFQEINIDKTLIKYSNAEIFLAILYQFDKIKFKYIKEKFAPDNIFEED
ncbi:MAG: hypothetical protein M3R36_00160 [Bacteroidota bacterium]|nr:hypothetical protein [Bacteroidota bacterium]